MKTFRDSKGREWAVEINVETVKRVKSRLGVLLTEILDDKLELLSKLAGADPILLCDVLFVVCEPEAITKNVDSEDFGRSLAGDAILNGSDALLAELADFFPNPRTRAIVANLRGKAKATMDAMLRRAGQAVENLDPEKIAEQVESQARKPGSSVSSSPAA